jgi:tRNA A37 threonylcarbamoyladenosine synthetase subunit TsaC/SUA5/YrdC
VTPTDNAAACLSAGGVIAHATEGVWGLACDPNNDNAVRRIISLKGRDADKGLLLIAGSAAVFAGALAAVDADVRNQVVASWPGHVTWLLPGDDGRLSRARSRPSETNCHCLRWMPSVYVVESCRRITGTDLC